VTVDAHLRRQAHDNLVLWSRVYGEHNHARTTTVEGLFLGSLAFQYAGFRVGVPVGPTRRASIDAARAFFAGEPEGFVIYSRPDVDTELAGNGVIELFRAPQMVCTEPPAMPSTGADVEVVLTRDHADLHDYAVVAGRAFADLNFPADQTTASLDRPSFIDDPRVSLAVARVDGTIVAGALAVTEGTGSYISFVAADREGRRHGLGDAVTRLVTRAGFEAGASMASLEASPFGYHIYERMGFREIYQYALLVVVPPKH
jgi:ribosomal protein S18 acetylase RimI-like enzyme